MVQQGSARRALKPVPQARDVAVPNDDQVRGFTGGMPLDLLLCVAFRNLGQNLHTLRTCEGCETLQLRGKLLAGFGWIGRGITLGTRFRGERRSHADQHKFGSGHCGE